MSEDTEIQLSGHNGAVPPLPAKVAEAIANVMAEVPKLGRDAKNSHGNYNFASVDDFLEALRPLCAAHGLLVIQDEEQFALREGEGSDKYGKPTKTVWLLLSFRFTLAHTSGETWAHRPTRSIMVNASMGSQAFGAAQSYTLKQFMRSLFQVATGEKGQDADEHPPAELPKRKSTRGPDWGKANQARNRGDWDVFIAALKDCQSAHEIDRLEREYLDNDAWSAGWKEKASEECEKYRADFKEPGEALTLKEQLEGSLEAEKAAEPETRAAYIQHCHDAIENLDTEFGIDAWWVDETPARRRFRLTPAEETDLKARAKARIKALRSTSQTTIVPNARERAAIKDKAGNELHPIEAG